jgi:AraC-like DNA-binding protein
MTATPKSYRLLCDALDAPDDPRALFVRAVRRTVHGFVSHASYVDAAARRIVTRPERLMARELAFELNPLAALFTEAPDSERFGARWNGFNAAASLGVRTRIDGAALLRSATERQGAEQRAALIAACVDALAGRAAHPHGGVAGRGELERGWDTAAGGGVLAELLPLLYGEPGTPLDVAARRLGCSLRTVQRALAGLGLTYELLRQAVRLTLAGRALRLGTLSVTEVAHACGFFDAAHLNRAWRAACDITPLRYRALARL